MISSTWQRHPSSRRGRPRPYPLLVDRACEMLEGDVQPIWHRSDVDKLGLRAPAEAVPAFGGSPGHLARAVLRFKFRSARAHTRSVRATTAVHRRVGSAAPALLLIGMTSAYALSINHANPNVASKVELSALGATSAVEATSTIPEVEPATSTTSSVALVAPPPTRPTTTTTRLAAPTPTAPRATTARPAPSSGSSLPEPPCAQLPPGVPRSSLLGGQWSSRRVEGSTADYHVYIEALPCDLYDGEGLQLSVHADGPQATVGFHVDFGDGTSYDQPPYDPCTAPFPATFVGAGPRHVRTPRHLRRGREGRAASVHGPDGKHQPEHPGPTQRGRAAVPDAGTPARLIGSRRRAVPFGRQKGDPPTACSSPSTTAGAPPAHPAERRQRRVNQHGASFGNAEGAQVAQDRRHRGGLTRSSISSRACSATVAFCCVCRRRPAIGAGRPRSPPPAEGTRSSFLLPAPVVAPLVCDVGTPLAAPGSSK